MGLGLPSLEEIHQNQLLKTLSKSGVPPKSRLTDPTKTQALVQLFLQADAQRNRKDAILQGMFNGNPPYNTSKRRAASQTWRANFSSLEGKAYLSNGLVPYYDLFSSSSQFIDFQTAYGNPDQQTEWSGIITEELDVTLKKWAGFNYQMHAMLYHFIGYGQGFLAWNNTYDWHFENVPHRKLLVMDGTTINLEKLSVLVMEQDWQVHELWEKIQNEKRAADNGWNVPAVKEAIRHAVPHDSTNTINDWGLAQQKLKDHDLLTSAQSATVRAARVWVKEFGGKITELMVSIDHPKPEFLFRKERRYSSFYQVLAPFFLEVGDASWHGATGLGKDIVNMILAKDKLNCSELDSAIIKSSITLQAKSASAMDKMGLVQIGAFTLIPPDFNVLQSQIMGDITTVIAVNNDLDLRLSRNTGIYRATPQKPTGNPRTAEEAKMDYTASTVLGNSAMNRFYDQLDPCYGELVRRITNPNISRTDASSSAALDFQERCILRGVPKAALLFRKSVRAFRAMGNGSAIMRQQILATLAPYSAQWPETGQANFHDDLIAAFTNWSKVNRYNSKAERMGPPTDQENLAMLENAAMKVGSDVQWTPTQNNLIHAKVHLKSTSDAVASLPQGADPTHVLAYLEKNGLHIGKHMQPLSKDPSHQTQFKELEDEFKVLGQITDKLHGHVQKMMEQQQEEAQKQQQAQSIAQGTDGDTAIKIAETKAKIGMATAKGQQGMQMKEQKHQQSMMQAQQDMQIKDAQAASQIAIEHAKAQAKTK